mgnify:CR=1 FL=1
MTFDSVDHLAEVVAHVAEGLSAHDHNCGACRSEVKEAGHHRNRGVWNPESMARILPPPPERFDPITARWLTPGGPLHDPERESFDPDHVQPVELIGPISRELIDSGADVSDGHANRVARHRRGLVTVGLASGPRWVCASAAASPHVEGREPDIGVRLTTLGERRAHASDDVV